MQIIIELIRKLVVLVLLMEVVLQLQSGKQYEPYIKMLIGIMVVYSLVSGLFRAWNKVEADSLAPMQEFQWVEGWYEELGEQAEKMIEQKEQSNMQHQAQEARKIEVAPISDIFVGTIEVGIQ